MKRAIKRAKSSSTPLPYDQIPYKILQKCPSLHPAILDLYNKCWLTSKVPKAWKVAAIKLIGKEASLKDPTTPVNFRPIALTSCIGKVLLSFMIDNNYLDKSVQRALCQLPLAALNIIASFRGYSMQEARSVQKSLAVAWLEDLANAYGSVHHSLILFSMKHYHVPPQFTGIVDELYSGLSAKILMREWSTSIIPLNIGVYQGDPLSVVIFNTVINTLADTLRRHSELGYRLSKTSYTVNQLQYADDTCLLANCPAACQQLLNITDQWLSWANMKAKVVKCHSAAIQSTTGHIIDPELELSGEKLPFIKDKTIKFLGLPIKLPKDNKQGRVHLHQVLHRLLKAVDQCPVTRRQKLKLWKLGVCPRLNWLLTIYEFPLSWIERQLEGLVTRHLKKWAGLAKSANPNVLYLPKGKGGLEIPSITSLYKSLQVSRLSQQQISV